MIHDLDDILITNRVEQSWLVYLGLAIENLTQKFPNLQPSEIPDEQLRELENGNAEIFVKIKGVELKMSVPKEEWSISH